MNKSRFVIISFSALYLALIAVLFYQYRQNGNPYVLKPEASNRDLRVFCWNGENETYEEMENESFENVYENYYGAPKSWEADLDGDGFVEKYELESGVLTISRNLQVVWMSDETWHVDSFYLADSNNDGVQDINLSVWKPGNFGDMRPFWVEENDMSVKNHFFIFNLADGRIKPVWQSSNLSAPNCRILVDDVDGDGNNELIVIEGDYGDSICTGKYLAVWKWDEWGFLNEWRSGEGNFEEIAIFQKDGRKCFAGF